MTTDYDMVDECIRGFNAAEAAAVYAALDWHWRNQPHTPTIAEIRAEARRLCEHALWHCASTECGGLYASCDGKTLVLKMIAVSAEVPSED